MRADVLWEGKSGKVRGEITYSQFKQYEFTKFHFFRVYKTKENQWERAGDFTIDNLEDYKKLIAEAEQFIKQHELTQKWPDRPGEQNAAPKPNPERRKKPEEQPLDMKFSDEDFIP